MHSEFQIGANKQEMVKGSSFIRPEKFSFYCCFCLCSEVFFSFLSASLYFAMSLFYKERVQMKSKGIGTIKKWSQRYTTKMYTKYQVYYVLCFFIYIYIFVAIRKKENVVLWLCN